MSDAPGNPVTLAAVIPAHNAAAHIARALDSVLAQARPADQIIVVDDGSTDNTAEIVARYAPAVTLLGQPNAGAGPARNRAIRAATAQWIAFLDADDEWLPDKLQLQLDHLARHPQLHWACANFHIAAESAPPRLARPPELTGPLLAGREFFEDYLDVYPRGIYAWTGTVIARRQTLLETGLFAENMPRAQDTDLWLRLAYRHPAIGYLPTPLAIYHTDTPQSNTKLYGDPAILARLIERHLEISRELQRLPQFRPCAAHMLQLRIRELHAAGANPQASFLLKKFASLLPPRFRAEMLLQLHTPPLANLARRVLGRPGRD